MARHTVYVTLTEQTLWRVSVEADTPAAAPAEALRLVREDGWHHAKQVAVLDGGIDHLELDGSPATFCRNCGLHILGVIDPHSPQGLLRWQSADDGHTACPDGNQHQPG
jgi:hypothetical protein